MKVCVFGLWHLGSVTAACLPTYGVDTVRMQGMLESVRASVTRSSELLEHLIWHASRATDGEPYSDGGAAEEFPQ